MDSRGSLRYDAGEIAQWKRQFAAPVQDPSLVPSPHPSTHARELTNIPSSNSEDNMPPQAPSGTTFWEEVTHSQKTIFNKDFQVDMET